MNYSKSSYPFYVSHFTTHFSPKNYFFTSSLLSAGVASVFGVASSDFTAEVSFALGSSAGVEGVSVTVDSGVDVVSDCGGSQANKTATKPTDNAMFLKVSIRQRIKGFV
jgi:hypothetical protein